MHLFSLHEEENENSRLHVVCSAVVWTSGREVVGLSSSLARPPGG